MTNKKVGPALCNKDICRFAFSFLIVFVTAAVGSIFIGNSAKSIWYESIKPSITPPNWVFPLAWTTLFLLLALSLYLVWTNAEKKRYKYIFFAYGSNLILNALWSLLYFRLRMPIVAFIEVILLWVSILIMMKVAWKINKKAFWLLVPYLLWVTFAMLLNYLSI